MKPRRNEEAQAHIGLSSLRRKKKEKLVSRNDESYRLMFNANAQWN
jgi:hypothetical protein